MPKVLSPLATAKKIGTILENKKGLDITILDLRKLNAITDFFVICSGTSTRHVNALSEEVQIKLKSDDGIRANSVEGSGTGNWVLIDYVDVIVHLFHHETREFYNLEKLWHEARKIK